MTIEPTKTSAQSNPDCECVNCQCAPCNCGPTVQCGGATAKPTPCGCGDR